MIDHVVLLRLKDGVTQSHVDAMYESILGLKGKIDGIVSVVYGPNNSPEGKDRGYTEGFIMRFRDAQSRDKYLPHPEHVKVAQNNVRPIADDVLVFDLEVQ